MDKDLSNYLTTIKEHIEECNKNLDDYHKKLLSEKLDNKDYFAVERLLQVLIESGIGIAKQLVKALNKTIHSSGYDNFQVLYDLNIIRDEELKEWQSMIGLRNIIVHEYLKINRAVINSVLEKQLYKQAQVFCDAMLKHFS